MRIKASEATLKNALIANALSNGMGYDEIAEKYHCSRSTISTIAKEQKEDNAALIAFMKDKESEKELIRKAFRECWTKRPGMKEPLVSLMKQWGWDGE